MDPTELTPAIAILTDRFGYSLVEAIATKQLLRTASFVKIDITRAVIRV
jgi:hypothetical protein